MTMKGKVHSEFIEQRNSDDVFTNRKTISRLSIFKLGWSRREALETRLRLLTFEEDWDAPGMDGYDEL